METINYPVSGHMYASILPVYGQKGRPACYSSSSLFVGSHLIRLHLIRIRIGANVGISCYNLSHILPALAVGPSVKDKTPVRRVPK